MSSASSDRSMHPLDIMPAWAWGFAGILFLITVSLFGILALDIYDNACMTTHAICAKGK